MNSKRSLLKKSGIYLVADIGYLKNKDISKIINASLKAGVDIIQLRGKNTPDLEFLKIGRLIRGIVGESALFIINDRVDLALALDADGIHLGQEDLPLDIARKILGEAKIIGLSTHSLKQLKDAQHLDVDYISVGPVFKTPTKPDYKEVGLELVRKARSLSRVPFVAIGGISCSNIRNVAKAGAYRVALVRAILCAKDPARTTKKLKAQLYMVSM